MSLAYNAAHAMGLEPLPTGLGLRVAATDPRTGLTKMQDFDKLTWREVRTRSDVEIHSVEWNY